MMLLKRLCKMNWFKLLNAIQAIDTSDLVERANYNTKIEGIEQKIPYYDKYITANAFDNLTKGILLKD